MALFALGAARFALPVERILHILPAREPYRLPLLRAGIDGVLIDRDEVVPVLAQAPPFFAAGSEEVPALHVICEAEAGRVALPAGRVLQMVEREAGTVAEPEAARGDSRRLFIYQNQEYPWLDIDQLLLAPCNAQTTLSTRIEEA